MNILITGGNGFVGQHLIHKLSKKNVQITAICRNKYDKFYYDINSYNNVKVLYGKDITNYEVIKSCFAGMDVVFHLAASISFRAKLRDEIMRTNVIGTENVIKACKENLVERLIHVSSTAAFGCSDDIIDENFKYPWSEDTKHYYSYSKYLSEELVENSGLNWSIVNPSFILGPGGESNAVKLFSSIKKQRLFLSPPGGNSIVDVRDVANALVYLFEEKISGKFILSSASPTFKQLSNLVASNLGVRKIRWCLPKIAYPVANIAIYLYEKVSSDPKLSPENIYYLFKNRRHSSEKLKQTGFSFQYTPNQTIVDTMNYLEENKVI